MQHDRQFDAAQIGGWVAAGFRHAVEHKSAQRLRQLRQYGSGKPTRIVGRAEILKVGRHDFASRRGCSISPR
ncbi:hypothetical protein [Burkholderia alba]